MSNDLRADLRGIYGRALVDDVNDILSCQEQIARIKEKLEKVNSLYKEPSWSRQDLLEVIDAIESLTMEPGASCLSLEHSIRDAIDFIKARIDLG
jgi:hypothetical protein